MADGDVTANWFDGLDDEHKGHVQTKQWDRLEPAAAAIEAVKAHRAAEKHFGAPASEMLRIPKLDDAEGQKAFWQKLGAQPEKANYKFEELKFSDGKPLDQKLVDAYKDAAFDLQLPMDKAAGFVSRIMQQMESADKATLAEKTAIGQAERAKLAENWGTQAENNKFIAGRAMAALGIPSDAVNALENLPGVGYAFVMEMFRDLGVKLGEARFVSGGGNDNKIMSREQAVARKAELMADHSWGTRWINNGPNSPERKEMWDIDTIINRPAQR